MNYNALSLEQTPPFSVPLPYFLTAPLFAMAAAVLLLFAGPSAFSSRWTPAVLGMTHFLTLGFAAMVMLGAMQQLLPVLAGARIPMPRVVSRALHALLSVGALSLGMGLYLGQTGLLGIALGALGLLVAGFVAVAGYSLVYARAAHATVRCMKLAVLALAVTGTLGLYLATGHAFPELGLPRQLTDLHLTWGLLGWVGILVMGVGYQVVPMFQVTPNYPRWVMAWLAPVVFGGLAVWSVAAYLYRGGLDVARWPEWLGAAVVGAGVIGFALATLDLQRRRRRRLPDVTLSFWRLGMGCLAVSASLWLAQPWLIQAGVDLQVGLGILLVGGFTVSVINGMLYKIVPFLVWLHLNNRLQQAGRWRGRIPNMKQVIPERRARLQFRVHVAAIAALLTAAWQPTWFVYPAGAAFLFSNALLWANLVQAALLYRRVSVAVAGGAE
jgi:hypothetical protein